MLIKDLSFIEQTEASNSVNGGTFAFTGVDVFAFGGQAGADAVAGASGDSTGANTNTNTRTSSGKFFQLGTATGTATAYAVTVDGKNSSVATSYTTGVQTSLFR